MYSHRLWYNKDQNKVEKYTDQEYRNDRNYPNDFVRYKNDTPLVWIGGDPVTGINVICHMLDNQPDVRCGTETVVISWMLLTHALIRNSKRESEALIEAKVDDTVLNRALGAYILSILSQNGEIAPRICNPDPLTPMHMTRLLQIFPKSKFIVVTRDNTARRKDLTKGKNKVRDPTI